MSRIITFYRLRADKKARENSSYWAAATRISRTLYPAAFPLKLQVDSSPQCD